MLSMGYYRFYFKTKLFRFESLNKTRGVSLLDAHMMATEFCYPHICTDVRAISECGIVNVVG